MKLGQTYAAALLETAQDAKTSPAELEAILRQLDTIARLLEESKDLRIALAGPATSPKEKAAVLDELCAKISAGPLVKKFLGLMARKNRLGFVAEVRDAFEELRVSRDGGVVARLTSAEPLDEHETAEVLKLLESKFKRKVLLRRNVDPRLVAGMKVTVNGITYDGTLRVQLQRLRDKFVFGVKKDH